jgi:hypothetical protein
MKHAVYIRLVLATILIPLVLISAINLVVDPLNVYRLVSVEGFNQIKPRAQRFERLAKPLQLQRYNPELLILGTSRAAYGLDPESPWLKRNDRPAFNAGVMGATLLDMVPIARHAALTTQVKELVVDIDFFMFNAYNNTPWMFPHVVKKSPGDIGYLPAQWLSTLPSWDILDASRATLTGQDEYNRLGPLGLMDNEQKVAQYLRKGQGLAPVFDAIELDYAQAIWSPCANNAYQYTNGFTGYDTWQQLDKMLLIAAENDLSLTLFTQPVHARIWVLMQETGFWATYEQWQRDLAAHVEAFRQKHPDADVKLWTFSFFNDITSEPYPPAGDTTSAMQNFVDPAHYRTQIGEKVLETLAAGEPVPGFGVPMTSAMLPAHQAMIRRDRDAYRQAHPEAVAATRKHSAEGLAYREAHGIQCPR